MLMTELGRRAGLAGLALILLCLGPWEGAGVRPAHAQREESERGGTDESLDSRFRPSRNRNTNPQTNNQQDRSQRRTNQQRTANNNERQRPGQQGQQGQQGQPPQGEQRTVRGRQAPPAAPAAGSGSTGSVATPEFKMTADERTNLLFIELVSTAPTMNIGVSEGEEFITRVTLRNSRRSSFDEAEISLRYDPDVLEPIGVDDRVVRSWSTSPSVQVDRGRGLILFMAQFPETVREEHMDMMLIKWRARRAAANSRISFVNSLDHPTRILGDFRNILHAGADAEGGETSERRGLLEADVAVAPGAQTRRNLDDVSSELGMMQLISQISDGTAAGGVSLSLRPQTESVGAGEEFLVDVVYQNPNRADVDSVRLKLRFDPSVLEVVDFDEGNWITKGLNIFDGDYHEEFPWDFHIRNVAYNNTGIIQYEKGLSSRTRLPSSGTIATIKFRAKRAVTRTQVYFDFDETEETLTTAVTFLGFNLVGRPGERVKSLTAAQLSVN